MAIEEKIFVEDFQGISWQPLTRDPPKYSSHSSKNIFKETPFQKF